MEVTIKNNELQESIKGICVKKSNGKFAAEKKVAELEEKKRELKIELAKAEEELIKIENITQAIYEAYKLMEDYHGEESEKKEKEIVEKIKMRDYDYIPNLD